MDPLSLTVLALFVLAGGGATAAAVVAQRRTLRHEAMRQAVRAPVPCGPYAPVSLFDVFWDLGASEFALAMMARRNVLLTRPEDRSTLVHNLGEDIAASGGMAAYVADQIEAIEEYYRDHAGAGDRRRVLALAAPGRKLLPAVAGGPDEGHAALDVGYAAHIGGVDDRDAWRAGTTTGPLQGGGDESGAIDLDEAVATDMQALLRSIFGGGSIATEVKRWFAMRTARKLRGELDRALTTLHGVYVAHVRTNSTSHAHLRDSGQRWLAEATRVDALAQAAAFRREPWALCATVLLQEAGTMARELAARAELNVEATLLEIDAHAERGETAMAGYLVYVNRYAFFVGRTAVCETAVAAIESVLGRLATELQSLRRKGVV